MSLRVLSEILEEIKKNCINRDVETHVKTNCDVEKFLTVLKKLVIVQVRASRFPLLLKEKSSSSSPVKFSLELHKSPVFLVALELLFSVRAAGLLEKHPEMIVLFLKLLKSALTEHEQDFTHAAQEVSRERGAETVKDGLRYHPEYGLHKAQANLMKSICDVLISKEQLGGGKTSCDKDRRQLVDTCKSSLYKLQQQQQQQLHLRGLEDPFVDTEMQGFTQSLASFLDDDDTDFCALASFLQSVDAAGKYVEFILKLIANPSRDESVNAGLRFFYSHISPVERYYLSKVISE